MTNPLVSIVIPVFNEEKRIRRAITSMQSQTYENIEIIVVDDGSTDDTVKIVEEITALDPRVSFYKPTNLDKKKTNWRGYDINAGYDARNFGFKKAKGDWITTQDADDASLRNRVETQLSLALKYDALLVTVDWQQYNDEIVQKKLNTKKIFSELPIDKILVKSEEIKKQAEKNRGVCMIEPFHKWIPFPIKWFPYTRTLFFKKNEPYPGADNCMFFNRKIIEDGIFFRKRNERTWGVPSGRGSGRDFVFRVAKKYGKSFSFRLPLYLWDVNIQNERYTDYEKYLD